MRALAGAILILTAEQAFAHAFLVGFPHQSFVQSILLPVSGTAAVLGMGFLVMGFFTDRKPS
jgi:hypothetical protein